MELLRLARAVPADGGLATATVVSACNEAMDAAGNLLIADSSLYYRIRSVSR